jgi:hypothetical protein
MDLVDEEVGKGYGAIDRRAAILGMDDEAAEQHRRQFATQVHLGVITHLLESGQTAEAFGHLTAVRGELDAVGLAKSGVEKQIAAAGKRDEARDIADKVWGMADGDPKRAAELVRARGIKDTALLDDVMERVRGYAGQAAQFRREADSPRLGRLEQKLLQPGGRFSENDEDFVQLSDEGKADALRLRKAEMNRRRESGASARREQMERDRYFAALFDGLDMVGEQGQDKVSVNVDDLARQYNASPTAMELVRGKQKGAQTNVAKDQGVAAGEFRALLDDHLRDAGVVDKKQTDAIRKFANSRYARWSQEPKNAGIPPPPSVVDEWMTQWFLKGTVKGSGVFGYFQDELLGVQAEMDGKELEGVAPAAPAPKDARPRRTDPKTGETRVWNGSAWVKE